MSFHGNVRGSILQGPGPSRWKALWFVESALVVVLHSKIWQPKDTHLGSSKLCREAQPCSRETHGPWEVGAGFQSLLHCPQGIVWSGQGPCTSWSLNWSQLLNKGSHTKLAAFRFYLGNEIMFAKIYPVPVYRTDSSAWWAPPAAAVGALQQDPGCGRMQLWVLWAGPSYIQARLAAFPIPRLHAAQEWMRGRHQRDKEQMRRTGCQEDGSLFQLGIPREAKRGLRGQVAACQGRSSSLRVWSLGMWKPRHLIFLTANEHSPVPSLPLQELFSDKQALETFLCCLWDGCVPGLSPKTFTY